MDIASADPQLASLGIQLTDALARNTASGIADQINTLRKRKSDAKTFDALEEIINNLIQDKSELIQISRAYQEELGARQISPAEIEYVSETILPLVETMTAHNPESEKLLEVLTPLLSVEAISVMQLLGYNFREAIGQPLTELTSQAIRSIGTGGGRPKPPKQTRRK